MNINSRSRNYEGPSFLSVGFRPFFLLGALQSGLSMMLWLPQFYGHLQLATLFAPIDWHIHELFFGFLAAIVTGFLFTAVPNWTGRMPIRGRPLAILVLIWLAGRLAVTYSVKIGWVATMAIDLAFLVTISAVIAREIIAGKNWRNLKVLLPMLLLLAANAGFHLEANAYGVTDISRRMATAAPTILIMLIGGRIVPSFTRNWLNRENPGRLPAPFNSLDVVSVIVAVAGLLAWIGFPDTLVTGLLLAAASILQFARLARWAGERTLREPLVTMLHVGYLFVPAGLGLLALSQSWPNSIPNIAGMHALGAGAVGCMTLAVMMRASLGHTGQDTRAGWIEMLLFAAVFTAAITRIAASFDPGPYDLLLQVAALGWFIAFAGFGVSYGSALFRQKS